MYRKDYMNSRKYNDNFGQLGTKYNKKAVAIWKTRIATLLLLLGMFNQFITTAH